MPARKPGRRPPVEQDALRERAAEVYELAQAGWTITEIAEHFGVTEKTLYLWRQKHPKLDEAMRMGANLPNERVVASVFRQAAGYDYKEEQAIKLTDARGNERVEIVTVTKHQPADKTASIFWLKNRKRDEWNDGQQVDVNVKTDAPDPTQLALALLATMQAAVAQQQAAQEAKVIEHDDDE